MKPVRDTDDSLVVQGLCTLPASMKPGMKAIGTPHDYKTLIKEIMFFLHTNMGHTMYKRRLALVVSVCFT